MTNQSINDKYLNIKRFKDSFGFCNLDFGFFIKIWPLIIFTFALAVRFLFLSHFQNNPFFDTDVKGVDPSLYHEWAKDLALGYWPGYKLLYGHPFYPYLVSFFYKFWAVDSFSIVVLQYLAGSLSCVLLYFIARQVFSAPVGMISSLMAALYGPFLFYEGLMVPNALAIVLNLGAVLMLLNILEFTNIRRTFLAGLLLGCSLITNSGIAPFIIMAAFWAAFLLRKEKKSALAHISVIFIGVALPLLLISFKHFAAEGSFDSFGAHGGINFYVGNNPGANGTFRPPLGFTPSAEGLSGDSVKYAESVSGRRLTAAAVSGFWYRKAFSYITAHPFQWSNLVLKKFVLFWNKTELGDVADYYIIKKDSILLKFNPFVFGLIAPLGLLGMILARRDMRKAFLLYAAVASFMFSCLLFFVNSRYRLSATPFLIIFSGFAVRALWQHKQFVLYAVFLAVFLVFSNVTVISADTCTPLYNLSVIYAKKGMYDEAIDVSKRLLKQDWGLPMVHFNMGVCFYGKKMINEAVYEFKEAIRLNPHDYDSHFNLGLIYYGQKDFKTAFKEFKASLRGGEKDFASYYWLGRIYEGQVDYKAARQEYMSALKINPEAVQLKKAMGRVVKKAGI